MSYLISKSHSLALKNINIDLRNSAKSLDQKCHLEHLNLVQSSFFPCKSAEECPIRLQSFCATQNSEWPADFYQLSDVTTIKQIEEDNNRGQKCFLTKFLARNSNQLCALSEVRQPNRWLEGLLPTPPAS